MPRCGSSSTCCWKRRTTDTFFSAGDAIRSGRSVAFPGKAAMLPRNAWYIGAWADELGARPRDRRICNEPIVLFRDSAGRAAALADRCCHRAAPLHLGEIVEGGIQCGYHGLTFDGSGTCVRIPGQ